MLGFVVRDEGRWAVDQLVLQLCGVWQPRLLDIVHLVVDLNLVDVQHPVAANG
jgi:hypothetical protein